MPQRLTPEEHTQLARGMTRDEARALRARLRLEDEVSAGACPMVGGGPSYAEHREDIDPAPPPSGWRYVDEGGREVRFGARLDRDSMADLGVRPAHHRRKESGRRLSDDQVREIRRRHAEGQTPTQIARGLGCKKGQVIRVTSGSNYKEVQ